jgi:hypothetical protein
MLVNFPKDWHRLKMLKASGKIGYINKQGKLIIGYSKYTRAFNFKDGIALVGIATKTDPDGKFGYIDREGNLLESSSFNSNRDIPRTREINKLLWEMN